MRILFIDNAAMIKTDSSFYTHSKNGELMTALQKAGCDVYVFQFTNIANSISTFDLLQNRIRVLPQKSRKNKLWSYIVAYFKLTKAVIKCDFVYLYYPNTFKFILPICRVLHKKYGIYVRGMIGVKSRYSRWAYRHSSFVIETARFAEDTKCNAVLPRPMINYTEEDIYTERQYPLHVDNLKLLFLGRLDREKGLVELIHAVYVLKEKGRKIKLNIVGNGGDSEMLKAEAAKLDIMDIVNFHGPEYNSQKVKELYLSADAYVIPTYHEGFPRTIYEAMIFGTPVITTMVGGIPDVMIDGRNCKAIEVKSIQSISSSVEYIMEHYEDAISWAKNGFESVRKVLQRPTHAETIVKEICKTNKLNEKCHKDFGIKSSGEG